MNIGRPTWPSQRNPSLNDFLQVWSICSTMKASYCLPKCINECFFLSLHASISLSLIQFSVFFPSMFPCLSICSFSLGFSAFLPSTYSFFFLKVLFVSWSYVYPSVLFLYDLCVSISCFFKFYMFLGTFAYP